MCCIFILSPYAVVSSYKYALPQSRLPRSSTALNYDVVTMTPLFATQLAACTSIIGMGAFVESKGEQEVEIEECAVDLKVLGEGKYALDDIRNNAIITAPVLKLLICSRIKYSLQKWMFSGTPLCDMPAILMKLEKLFGLLFRSLLYTSHMLLP